MNGLLRGCPAEMIVHEDVQELLNRLAAKIADNTAQICTTACVIISGTDYHTMQCGSRPSSFRSFCSFVSSLFNSSVSSSVSSSTHCEHCINAIEAAKYNGCDINVPMDMTEEEYDRLIKQAREEVEKKFDGLSGNPFKGFLEGVIATHHAKGLDAPEASKALTKAERAFNTSFYQGINDAMYHCGNVLAALAVLANTEEEKKVLVVKAFTAFIYVMQFHAWAKFSLAQMLLSDRKDIDLTLRSIKMEHKDLVNGIIQNYLLQNQTEIAKHLQTLLNEQAETVCPHV